MPGKGYELEAVQTISAATELARAAEMAKAADDELLGVGSLPAAGAGTSIGSAMLTFEAEWHTVLMAVRAEMQALAKNVKSGATVAVAADDQVRDRFRRFSV